jgi:hypothetical protein
MEKAIKRAIEGGYFRRLEGNPECNCGDLTMKQSTYYILLDPEFWKCLGKSEGWTYDEWLYRWHELIDHLAKEKDIDSFFNGILK